MHFREIAIVLSLLLGGCAATPDLSSNSAPCSRAEPPVYPRQAAKECIEGYVTMEFSIESNGCVKNIQITESEPSGVFDDAARQSLATWRFDTNGFEEERTSTQTIDFTLGESVCTPHNKSLNADAG